MAEAELGESQVVVPERQLRTQLDGPQEARSSFLVITRTEPVLSLAIKLACCPIRCLIKRLELGSSQPPKQRLFIESSTA